MTNFLLDTNALIWLYEGSPRIKKILPYLSIPKSKVFISAVSWWEIAIKERNGKIDFSSSQLEKFTYNYDFYDLHITKDFLNAYLGLPKFPKLHKDPFDHMLLAQAITCPMRLITGDSELAQYSSLVMVI
ncbi:MAG: type II toxin-antitoxin system VapC family toxin [Treponema sp.]|nr:type II toxin-antitoxin system VapC family toxin [Treponema sp.]